MAYCTESDIEYQVEEEILTQLTNDRDVNSIGVLAEDSTSENDYLELTNSDEFPDTNGRVRIGTEEIDYETNNNTTNQLSGLRRAVNFTVEESHEAGDTVTEIHTVDEDVITRAIESADSIIDSFLGTRFNNLPFSDVPNVIRFHSVCITVYLLYSRRESCPNIVEEKYNFSLSFLERVLEGKINLDSSVDVSSDLKDSIITNTYEADKHFSIGSPTLGTTGTLDDY